MGKLLDNAKAVPKRNLTLKDTAKFDEGEAIELSLAWLKGEINHKQAAKATGRTGSALYGLIAVSLQRALDKGLLIIKKSA
jgi:hypothetical protein